MPSKILFGIYLTRKYDDIIQMNSGLFILLAAFACINGFQIEPLAPKNFRSTSLSGLQGFPYSVGKDLGEEKAVAFLNFINTAATLYRDDMQKNLKYIQSNMQASFGEGNLTYSVVIQSNSTSSISNILVYMTGESFASYPTGTSLINPTWSYMTYRLARYDNWIPQYVPHAGQGVGVNQVTIKQIKDIVLKYDGTGKCTCQNIFNIVFYTGQFDKQYWNAVCHSQPISEGYVLVRDKQWVSMKPYGCYYLLFTL